VTQYERGVRVERIIEHRFDYEQEYYRAFRSAGSHKESDVTISTWHGPYYINVKKHEGLREKQEEQELIIMPRPQKSEVFTGFLRKKGRKTYIVLVNLKNGIEWILEPLTKEQEKKYQEMKKAKIEARKSTGVRVLSGVRPTKTTKRSKP
jgi:hypothetical protein